MDTKLIIKKIKHKQYCAIALVILLIMSVTCTPISRSELSVYKQKEVDYNERKKQHDEFVEMCEEYKSNYNNLAKEYDEIKQEFNSYKEKYNSNRDLKKELDDLKLQKQKYLSLIDKYSEELENL